MTDGSGLTKLIHKIVNDNPGFEVFEIYNLAAQSHVAVSFELPEYTGEVDGIGVLKILDAVNTLSVGIKSKIKFYQAGTSELYGKVLETPQNEKTPFNPVFTRQPNCMLITWLKFIVRVMGYMRQMEYCLIMKV